MSSLISASQISKLFLGNVFGRGSLTIVLKTYSVGVAVFVTRCSNTYHATIPVDNNVRTFSPSSLVKDTELDALSALFIIVNKYSLSVG